MIPVLAMVAQEATIIRAPALHESVCDDPDDDKFVACALAGRCRLPVSGDKHLLYVTGYRGVRVLRPRAFVDLHL